MLEQAGQAALEHRTGSKAPSLAGMWHWALQESSKALECPPPSLPDTQGALSTPRATSLVPCACKGELGAKDLLSTLGCGCLPWQHSKELLRPG